MKPGSLACILARLEGELEHAKEKLRKAESNSKERQREASAMAEQVGTLQIFLAERERELQEASAAVSEPEAGHAQTEAHSELLMAAETAHEWRHAAQRYATTVASATCARVCFFEQYELGCRFCCPILRTCTVARLEGELRHVKEKLRKAEGNSKERQQEASAMVELQEAMQTGLKAAQAEAADLKGSLFQAKLSEDELKASLAEHVDESQEALTVASELRQELVLMQHGWEVAKAEAAALEASLSQAKQSEAELKVLLVERNCELQEALGSTSELKQELNAMQQEFRTAQTETADLKQVLQESAQAEATDLKQSLSQAQRSEAELRGLLVERNRELQQALAATADLKQSLKGCESQAAELARCLEATTSSETLLKASLAEREREIQEALAAASELKRELEAAKEAFEATKIEVADLKQSLSVAEQSGTELNKSLAEHERELQEALAAGSELKQELEVMQGAWVDAKAEAGTLKQSLAVANNKLQIDKLNAQTEEADLKQALSRAKLSESELRASLAEHEQELREVRHTGGKAADVEAAHLKESLLQAKASLAERERDLQEALTGLCTDPHKVIRYTQ